MKGSFELNQIYCADCYEAIKQIPDKSVDLIVTDPPYLLETRGAGFNKTEIITMKFIMMD